MALRTQPIKPVHIIAGGGALALLLLLTFGTVIAVWSRAESVGGLSAADWAAIQFTVKQAFLSALFSVAIAIPVARAIARRRFPGRGVLVSLLGAPFILPAIVAVLGLLSVWGRAGYFSTAINALFGGEPLNIYGLKGVILAHVFFNLPLATRLILQGWQSIPTEQFRLAAQLGFREREIARELEWPMLRPILPGVFLVIFLLCTTSFAVVLAMGGGPKATTVELAIFQALRFDFDLSKAAYLALVQFGICTVAAAAAVMVARPTALAVGLDRELMRWDARGLGYRIWDLLLILLVSLFLILPVFSLLIKGLPNVASLPVQVWSAVGNSLAVALVSALLSTGMCIAIGSLILRLERRRTQASWWVEGVGFLTLAASPFVIGTGLFIVLNPYVDPFAIALPITAVVNAAMSLPFALRIILPALKKAEQHYGKLADSIGVGGWSRFRLAIWPRIQRPVGFATGLSAALSMGDLGVIALFAPPDIATLPLTMYRLMSAYQMDAANGVALILIALSLCLFWIFDRGGRLEHRIR